MGRGLKRLEVFEHRPLFVRRKRIGKIVACSAFPETASVEVFTFLPAFLCVAWQVVVRLNRGTNAVLVKRIAISLPDNRPLFRIQHMPQRRHAAIVEIGSTGPYAIKRGRDIAAGIANVFELAKTGK